MKSARTVLRVVALGLAVSIPVSADAPTTGPEKQYKEFTSNDRYITDRFTKLKWQRAALSGTFEEAVQTCGAPDPAMRLPSLKELLTLVDEDPHREYDESNQAVSLRFIDRRAFPRTPPDEFWTSSVDHDRVWTVDFGTGTTRNAKPSDVRWFRCVNAIDAPP